MNRENTISKEYEDEYRHKCLMEQVNFWSMSAEFREFKLGVWSIECRGAAVPLLEWGSLDSHGCFQEQAQLIVKPAPPCVETHKGQSKKAGKTGDGRAWIKSWVCPEGWLTFTWAPPAFCNSGFVCNPPVWGLHTTAFCTGFLSTGTRNQSWTKVSWKFLNQ